MQPPASERCARSSSRQRAASISPEESEDCGCGDTVGGAPPLELPPPGAGRESFARASHMSAAQQSPSACAWYSSSPSSSSSSPAASPACRPPVAPAPRPAPGSGLVAWPGGDALAARRRATAAGLCRPKRRRRARALRAGRALAACSILKAWLLAENYELKRELAFLRSRLGRLRAQAQAQAEAEAEAEAEAPRAKAGGAGPEGAPPPAAAAPAPVSPSPADPALSRLLAGFGIVCAFRSDSRPGH
eukprot:tig00001208_g7521.t1